MVKIDTYKRKFEEIHDSGRLNSALIPKVENWCKHLDIECFSRGMVAQASNLINEVSLTCRHAAHPVRWHTISFVAEEFIKNNCIDCKFHEPRFEPNYGQDILAKIQSEKEIEVELAQKREASNKKVHEEVNQLLKIGKKKANQTQLSILNLIADLEEKDGRVSTAAKLSAAAKLDPGFFSDAAIEVLFLHFTDGNAGKDCIRAVNAVLSSRITLINKAFEIASSQIESSPHFDELAGILTLFINGNNVKYHIQVLSKLIDRLWYKRFVGEPAYPERKFEQSEALIIKIGQESPEILVNILSEELCVNEKNKRININFLLQKLMKDLPDLISELTIPLIKSLDFDDDQYEQSADKITIDSLCMIAKQFPETTIAILDEQIPKLSAVSQQAIVKINIQLLSDRQFADNHPIISAKITQDIINKVLNKGISEEVKDDASKQLSHFISDRPELFLSSFDGFLGYLSEVAENERLFDYYSNEIQTKEPKEYTTFNYLIGKNFFEIDNEKQKLIGRYRDIKKILRNLCKLDPATYLPKVYSLIPNLDSAKDERFKLELLSIVTESAKDPLIIAGFIPQLYMHLLDPISIDLRFRTLVYFERLVDGFPMVITSTLWDLFDIFLNDTETIAQGMALNILGTVARKMPERITPAHLTIHRNALLNPKVFIHKRAIDISEDLCSLMSPKERHDTLITLLRLLELYSKDEDKTQLFSIIDQIVEFSVDNPKLIYTIAEKFLFPLTSINEYYESKERIERLEILINQFPIVEPLWLKSVLRFLTRFPNDGGSHDDRLELYFKMHRLSEKTISGQLSEFSKLTSVPRTATQAHLDLASVLDVLGYFGLYESILEIAISLDAIYPDFEANKYLRRSINFWRQISLSEITSDPLQKLNHLLEAKNAYDEKK